eukprot:gnl/MRDRNA2_/MRDRNA2_56343_c0_seq1.p1 gnl/MRDRNA2_/MRDRNA2_56343_c0~~gnl/MRDRNA2_/MRDRNA2_56343_c0_seq1.p1  ORF type:complete len:1766 (-),score=343.64 gnl/MRDRNA2_/MRDRNA2_56343_c0_seq1:73-5370(-)
MATSTDGRDGNGRAPRTSACLCLRPVTSIFGRRQIIVDPDEPLRSFLHVAVGDRIQKPVTQSSHSRPPPIPLEELSQQKLTSLLALREKTQNAGLISPLLPFLADNLTRRLHLHVICDLLASQAEEGESSLPRCIMQVTSKDLFIALASTQPYDRQRHLALAFADLNAPLPVVFRSLEPKHPTGLHTIAHLDGFMELLTSSSQGPGRSLLLWCGTSRAFGKTQLLANIGFCPNIREDAMDLRPTQSLNHHGSVDVMVGKSFIIADVHGMHIEDAGFRAALLNLVAESDCLAVVQCGQDDFTAKQGTPSQELKEVLLLVAGSQNCSGVVLLVRDASSELKEQKKEMIEGQIRAIGGVVNSKLKGLLTVDNVTEFRSTMRKQSVVNSLHDDIVRLFGPQAVAPAACSKDVVQKFIHNKELFLSLDNERVSSKIFPLSYLQGRMQKLRENLELLQFGTESSTEKSFGLERLREGERRAAELHQEIERLQSQWQSGSLEPSASSKQFARMASQGSPQLLNSFLQDLDVWKEPKVQPLLEKRRCLLDCEDAAGSMDVLNDVEVQLSELDFDLDSFWAEIALLADKGNLDQADQCLLCLRDRVLGGYPTQLLRGSPLRMGSSKFLKSCLQAVDRADGSKDDDKGVWVVSVIGAQSSAKSTLMNFLFGCGFATKAGRCTRGLYFSYLRLDNGQRLIVLDSEGLLSLESRGGIFDGQMTLMAMACSHLVLVNHKGEISRQLQDLLEICLYAMKHLRVADVRPRICFVLRDQHDRSPAVHEDMLRNMKSNLQDAAKQIGIASVDELISLDSTAVFLLPSAFVTDVKNGVEVRWTTELFSAEILRLRCTIFGWLDDDIKNRWKEQKAHSASAIAMHGGYSSLESWYEHAEEVWETLIQFSSKLLHYRTITEIEVRKELGDIAREVVREALEGSPDAPESVTNSLRARAQVIVEGCMRQLQASNNEGEMPHLLERGNGKETGRLGRVDAMRWDVDAVDLELGRSLQCLKEEYVQRIHAAFEERTADPRFDETSKEAARRQLVTPLDWVLENAMYTWKLFLKRANDEQAMQELWGHFTAVLNRYLQENKHQVGMAAEEARALFEKDWSRYETAFVSRLAGVRKTPQTLAHETTLLFNHAVVRLGSEGGSFALLQELGPQLLTEGRPLTLLEKQPDDWEEEFFHNSWWEKVKKLTTGLILSGELAKEVPREAFVREDLVPKMKKYVEQLVQTVRLELQNGKPLDESLGVEWLRSAASCILDIEQTLLAQWSLCLRRPQFLNALHISIRVVCVEGLSRQEERKTEEAIRKLLDQKQHVEEHFLLMVRSNTTDVEKAQNFADLYHRSLMAWLDTEAAHFAASVRGKVLAEMPDPQRASERAFQQSFEARNWPEVLEYVLDVNSYLEKIFLQLFHRRKRHLVDACTDQMEQKVKAAYTLLLQYPDLWVGRVGERRQGASKGLPTPQGIAAIPTPQQTNVQPEESEDVPADEKPAFKPREPEVGSHDSNLEHGTCAGPAGSGTACWTVQELATFIRCHAEEIPRSAEAGALHRMLVERLPSTADFAIQDIKVFGSAFKAKLSQLFTEADFPKLLKERMDHALREQSLSAWQLIRGCSARCPLCGSKCDLVGDHAHHSCSHHLLPAFHGWMDQRTGLPSFNFCLCKETWNGKYQCQDGKWRNLEQFMKEDNSSWLPFPKAPSSGPDESESILQQAWVNCRVPLLEYFHPMVDDCPKEWIERYYDADNALTSKHLIKAKDTIRRIRMRNWHPDDEGEICVTCTT